MWNPLPTSHTHADTHTRLRRPQAPARQPSPLRCPSADGARKSMVRVSPPCQNGRQLRGVWRGADAASLGPGPTAARAGVSAGTSGREPAAAVVMANDGSGGSVTPADARQEEGDSTAHSPALCVCVPHSLRPEPKCRRAQTPKSRTRGGRLPRTRAAGLPPDPPTSVASEAHRADGACAAGGAAGARPCSRRGAGCAGARRAAQAQRSGRWTPQQGQLASGRSASAPWALPPVTGRGRGGGRAQAHTGQN